MIENNLAIQHDLIYIEQINLILINVLKNIMKIEDSRYFQKKILLLSFLALYITLSLFVDLFHNHDADYHFHDNCPACQWNIQAQDNHSEYEVILEYILRSIEHSQIVFFYESFLYCDNHLTTHHFSRAPPL